MEGHRVVPGDGAQRGLGPGRRAAVRVLGEHQPSQQARRHASPDPPPNGAPRRATSSRARSNSVSGKAGRSRASARRSRPSPRSFRSTESTTSLESRPPSLSRLPPTNSMARSLSRRGAGRAPPGEEDARSDWRGPPCPAGRGPRQRPLTPGRRRSERRDARRRGRRPRSAARSGSRPPGMARPRAPAGSADGPAWRAPRRQRSGRGPSRRPGAWRHYTGSPRGEPAGPERLPVQELEHGRERLEALQRVRLEPELHVADALARVGPELLGQALGRPGQRLEGPVQAGAAATPPSPAPCRRTRPRCGRSFRGRVPPGGRPRRPGRGAGRRPPGGSSWE